MKKIVRDLNNKEPLISVVIASYNNPRSLSLVLEGYRKQDGWNEIAPAVEIIVADDGSGPEVEGVFQKYSGRLGFRAVFIQQDHGGWGKLRMLNWSIFESKAPWIVFTDGDCIPHRHFLKSYLQRRQTNSVYCGRRVDLMEKLAPQLSATDVESGKVNSPLWLLANILKRNIDYGGQGFHLPEPFAQLIPFISGNRNPTILGSNFSIERKWLMELNGFDETFSTPGIGEDTDLERRIILTGLKLKWITYRAIQYHLWHPLTVVGKSTHNTYDELKQKGNLRAFKGIQELPESLKNCPTVQ